MQTATILKTLIAAIILCLMQDVSAAITIDSTSATPSRCANDGTIAIYGRSGTSMIYAIVSGPDIRPAQSGNIFSGLPSGTYQVMVTNFSNDTSFASATVGGNYVFPDFAPTFADPQCAGSATGVIVGNALATGRAPYSWTLTNTSSGAVTTQVSDSFLNLPTGVYTLRLFDSCQSFATRSITLSDPVHTFNITNINNRPFTCDSVDVYVMMFVTNGNYAAPYTVQVQTHNGTYQHVIDNLSYGGWYPDFHERVGGVSYGDYINITVTDACGNFSHVNNTLYPFNVTYNFVGSYDSCQLRYHANLAINPYVGQINVWPTFLHLPVTVRVSDAISGALVDSLVYRDSTGFAPFVSTSDLPAGHTYTVRVTDTCGHIQTSTIAWPVLAAPWRQAYIGTQHCYDSTISYSLTWVNYFSSYPHFDLLSGPATIHSTKPKYAYFDSIIYPQTYVCLPITISTSDVGYGIDLGNCGVGTYHYRVYDSCGHSLVDSFVIRPQDVADDHHTLTYTRGCPGQNIIAASYGGSQNPILFNGPMVQQYLLPDHDTARNINAGTYILSLNYNINPAYLHINKTLLCQVILDTIVIPPYELPKIDYATQVKCNGAVNVGLQPDSATGVAPYSYEILSGPQTAPVQASNFFGFTQPGTYVARISDVCGFARTFTFAVDTLSFQQIVKVGSSCPGNSALLIAQHSPYATYGWQRPNGTFYRGDTIRLNPVLATDYGVYHVIKYVTVNGCRDTFSTTYTLTSGSVSNSFATICAGQGFVFAGRTYTQAGVYYDTVHTSLCDSIVVLNLTIGGARRDSVSRSICIGQSITVGTHIYSAAGIYRDTFTTGGCDSIFVLNLQVGTSKRDSVSRSICAGQAVTVGTHVYNTTGIYRDTFATAGCDSIYVLNLQVAAPMRDSVSRSICTGQSVVVGTHVYSSTGIYRDTFSTSGCDSIHILNLQVGGATRDSLSQVICAGQSVAVGAHVYSATGIYRDTFSTVGCDSIHILNLTVGGVKRDSVSQTICPGQSVQVGTHLYSAAGIYRDTLLTSSGCDSIHILDLHMGGAKHDTVDATICQGGSTIIDNVLYTDAGLYTYTIVTSACDSMHSVRITVLPRPAIQIMASSTDVSKGDTVQLNISGDASLTFNWASIDALADYQGPNPKAIISQSGWVVVQATDTNNCMTADSIFIKMGDCEGSVFVPNAFTPNGDGKNDIYRIFGNCVKLNSLKIFNRWGEKVWESEDIEKGWDGTYRGAVQPPEVYVYLLSYSALSSGGNVAKQMQGSIALIR